MGSFLKAQKISMAEGYCFIVCPDSTVSAIGNNSRGQLGDSTYFNKSTPVKVKRLKHITDVSAPATLALQNDGTIWQWSWHGQYRMSKINLSDVIAISSCFESGSASKSFAIKKDGTLWTWANASGTYNGAWIEDTVPTQILGIPKVVSVRCSSTFSVFIALCDDGSVYTWGDSDANGNNTTYPNGSCPDIIQPTKVNSLSNIKAIAAGTGTAYALKNDGTVWFWGWIKYGSCYPSFPEKIEINNVKSISAEEEGLYMVKNDGTLWGWGFNSSGELGVGDIDVRTVPAQVIGLDNVSEVSANGYSGLSSIALKNDGTIWVWGYNHFGELGDSTSNRIKYPKKLSLISPSVDCYAKYPHPVALKLDTFVNMNSAVNLTCSKSQLYNWQYDWHGYSDVYSNSRTFQAYIWNAGRSIFASLIDSVGCYHYEQFNLHTTCDTFVKVKDKLVLDTTLVAGTIITLKASKAVTYFWFPWSTLQFNQVLVSNDIECTATLTDELGCNRIERFRLKKMCDSSSWITPKVVMDTITYLGKTLSLVSKPGYLSSWLPIMGLSCNNCSTTQLTVSKADNYIATTTDSYGCIQKEEFNIRIANCDTIIKVKNKIILDTLIHPGTQAQLHASNADSYQWNPAVGLSCTSCKSPTASILTNTEYAVTLTDKYNCQWTEYFKITNNCDSSSLTKPEIVLDTLTYPSATILLNAKEADSYSWVNDIGLTCNNCQKPSVSVTGPVEYVATLIDEFNCISKEKFIIRIRNCDTIQLDKQQLRLDTIINYPTEITLSVARSYNGYHWNQSKGLSCNDCQNPILKANATGYYIVELFDKWRCPFKEEFIITLVNEEVVIPNVITPNGDGINDYFEIKGLVPGSTLKVYDNKGKVVYTSNNYQGNWNGGDLSEGTYYYILILPEKDTYKGWVYLKR
jgi:gliding motility-associated-like protein